METIFDTAQSDLMMAAYQSAENFYYQPQVSYIGAEGRVPQYPQITPKPYPGCETMTMNSNEIPDYEDYQRCKRRLEFSPYCVPDSSIQRQYITSTGTTRRNARERNRVKVINVTFAKLREHLPQSVRGRKTRKMSKVDTLRAAIEYISCLQDLLDNQDAVNAVLSDDRTATEKSNTPVPDCGSQTTEAVSTSTSFPVASPCGSLEEVQSPSSSSSCTSPLGSYSCLQDEEELADFGGWF